MPSLSLIEKDSIATTRDSFKDVKLEIKCIQTSREKKFHKQSVVILLKNGCSVRYMFCTIFVPLSVAKALKNTFGVVHLVLFFFKENSHSHGKFPERLFSEPKFYRKINKIYQRKLKSGDRLWAVKITLWKLRLYRKLFCIRHRLCNSHSFTACHYLTCVLY